jgi:hypothetical protein
MLLGAWKFYSGYFCISTAIGSTVLKSYEDVQCRLEFGELHEMKWKRQSLGGPHKYNNLVDCEDLLKQ